MRPCSIRAWSGAGKATSSPSSPSSGSPVSSLPISESTTWQDCTVTQSREGQWLPMFQYQLNHRFFAQVPEGIEELAAQELTELGAERVRTSYRGVYFDAGKAVLYRV